MSYPPDPGRVFVSDAHRRVLGHLPLPDADPASTDAFMAHIADDPFSPSEQIILTDIVQELIDDGYAVVVDDGWTQTEKGLDALNAPLPEDN